MPAHTLLASGFARLTAGGWKLEAVWKLEAGSWEPAAVY